VLGPYIAKHHLGGAAGWAVVVTGEGIGALLGGVAGIRFRPRRTMLTIGGLFTVTALQSLLLAVYAPVALIGAGAALAGFAFSFGTVIWETSLQHTIPAEKLARVSAYNWMGAMAFLPAGYAIAGPVADAIGMSRTLVLGAVWIVLSTAAVLTVRSVRDFRLRDIAAGAETDAVPAAVPSI
jgi:MFS family permease